jgi:hypothetical protein
MTRSAHSDKGCAAACGLGLTCDNLPGVGRPIVCAASQEVEGISVFVGLFCLHLRPLLLCIRCVPTGGHPAAPSAPSAGAVRRWAERTSGSLVCGLCHSVPPLPIGSVRGMRV